MKYCFSYREKMKKEKVKFFCNFPTSIQIGEISGTMVGDSIIHGLRTKGYAIGFCGIYEIKEIKK